MTWTDTVLAHMYPWPIGVLVTASAVSLLFGVAGVYSLWRVKRMVAALPAVQERMDTLANSVTMLTDTTESCFKALSMQMQFIQSQGGLPAATNAVAARVRTAAAETGVEPGAKKGRQRRVVGAARRGEPVTEIAAREDLAEAEVALRLHLQNREGAPTANGKGYGALLS
jgi:hypothetical protein